MIESVRWPLVLPVCSLARSAGVMPSRLSEPTSRYVVPGVSAGRSPVGIASTLSILPHAYSGTQISTSRNNRTISPMIRPNQLRRFLGRAAGLLTKRGSMDCG
jgi:hypothetical protein